MQRSWFSGGAVLVGLFAAIAGLSSTAVAQAVVVRGTVVVAGSGEPVPGATVAVLGTEARAVTTERGEFTFSLASAQGTITVQRIGFAPAREAIAGRTTLTILLTPTAVQLTEVVTIGYGEQRRSDVTGAVTSVPQARLQDKPNVSVLQALEGSVPGIAVRTTGAGSEPTLSTQVRGRSSITASIRPLIVIDGIPYDGNISAINQNDVESISVLKDASATAIYGSRGSNGVLIITTKRGRVGKPAFAYSGYTGSQSFANLPRMMNGQEFAEFKCQRLRGGVNCETALTPSELAVLNSGQSTDWLALATRSGRQQQHQASVSGGSEETKYYLSATVLDVEGVAVNDRFQRYTGRLNLDQKLFSRITLGTNSQYSWADRGGIPADFSEAFLFNPLTTPYQEDGALTVYPWPDDLFWGNPLQGILATHQDVEKRLFTSNYLQADLPIRGLSYRLNAGMDIGNRDIGQYHGRDTRIGRSLGGRAIIQNDERNDWTVENILRFTRALGSHNFDLTALGSTAHSNLRNDDLTAQGFPNDVLTFYQSNVAALVLSQRSSVKSVLVSTMGRLNYNYADRYLATFTSRRDGFSGFGRNHKYGVFPSLALAWNASNESFWPSRGLLPVLKLRYSRGKNGNQAVRPYQTLSQLDDRSYLDGSTTAPGYLPVSLGNPDLKWETTVASNFGVDFVVGKGRVTGSIDRYTRNTRDLLLRRSISSVSGFSSILQNIGKTQNKGLELQMSTLNLSRGTFSWRTDLVYSRNRNKIVELYGDQTDDLVNAWFIGQPITVNYDYKFGGIWQLTDDIKNSPQPTAKPGDVRVVDVNGDGKIDVNDRTLIGSLEPSYTAGLTNTFTFGPLTLSGYFTSVQGVLRANPLRGSTQVQAEVRRNIPKYEYWTPTNPINTYPSNINETQGGGSNPLGVDFFEDASFVRLKDLSFAYQVPGSFGSRFGARSARVYLNGRNLWTKTKWTGLDPELSGQRSVPLEKSVIGGLELRF
ncbi:MAG: SusC/RagA family TonB-linked outer membrane protein [Gemmatimonadaceae bacterium]